MGKPLIDITGQRFGRLTVLDRAGFNGKTLWRCICDCGKETTALSPNLRKGLSSSCGCLKTDLQRQRMTKHGNGIKGAETLLYRTWKNMRQRCLNTSHPRYLDYGGRGVTICDRWNDFATFAQDMGEAKEGLTLDRIDVDGPYSLENCRWADNKTQMRNKRNNVWVYVQGQRMVREDARKLLGVNNRRMNHIVAAQSLQTLTT